MNFRKLLIGLAAGILALGGCDFGSPTTGGGTEAEGLKGTIVDAGGSPVAGAWVRVYPAGNPSGGLAKDAAATALPVDSAQTTASGAFNIPGLLAGTYNLTATVQRGDTTLSLFLRGVIVVAGNTHLGTDTLRVAGSVTLQVRTEDNPLEGAQCLIPGSPWQGLSGPSGNCVLTGLPPGTFEITVSHPSFQIAISGDVSVLSGILANAGLLNLIGVGVVAPAAPALVSPASIATAAPISGNLLWRASAGATTYHVQLAADPAFAAMVLEDSGMADTVRAYGPLAGGTGHYWRVRAKNAAGVSPWSASWAFITVGPAPASHFGIAASTVALWTFDAYDDSNRIPDLGPNGFHLSRSAAIPLETSPYGSAAVLNGTTHKLFTAFDNALTLAPTGRLTFETRVFLNEYPSTALLGSTADVMGMYAGIVLKIRFDGKLQITAQKLNGTGYSWYDAESAPGTVPLNRWVDIGIAVDQTVSPHQFYGYIDGQPVQLYGDPNSDSIRIYPEPFMVGHRNRDENVGFKGKIDEIRVSNDLALGPGLALIPPSPVDSFPPPAPTPLSPAQNASEVPVSPMLTWSLVNANFYILQISTDSVFPPGMIQDTVPTPIVGTFMSRQVGPLAAGTVYYWRVIAVGLGGSWGSETRRFTTGTLVVDSFPPDSPQLIAPAQNAADITVSPVLSWRAVAGASTYHAQISIDSGFGIGGRRYNDSLIKDTTKAIGSTLAAGTVHYWRVRAKPGPATSGPWSAIGLFTTAGEPPAPPSPPSPPAAPILQSPADLATGVSIAPTLSWNAASGDASHYRLQVAQDSAFLSPVINDSVHVTSRAVGPLANNAVYYWRVLAVNSGGNSASATRRFTTGTATEGTGSVWTPQASGTTAALYGLAWNDNLKLAVAVGDDGAIHTSPDGIDWTPRNSGTANILYAATSNGGYGFVAVGANGTILASPDGINWTTQTSGTANGLYAVTSGSPSTGSGAGQFVAAGANGTILTSPDGINWTAQASGTANGLYAVTWNFMLPQNPGPGTDLFVATGANGSVRVSRYGVDWSSYSTNTTSTLYSVGWHESGSGSSRFIAAGGSGVIQTSTEAVGWLPRASGTTDNLYSQAGNDSQRVVVGAYGTILASTNTTTWTAQASGTANNLNAIIWNGTRFVAAGDGGIVLTSP